MDPVTAAKWADLREKYIRHMEMEVTADPFFIEVWLDMTQNLYTEIEVAGFRVKEVTHP